MEKHQKNRVKKYISWILIVVIVVFLAVMPMMAGTREESEGPEASILSGTVERGDIDTVLVGGGSLSQDDPVEITIPASVKLTAFLVSIGDVVSEGDPVASVDRVTVMTAITEVQETLEYLAEEIETASEEEVCDEVIAQAGGIVKVLYAQEGENVRDVMLRDGALAVLSLDRLMAVKLETEAALSAGDSVLVTLSDGTEVDGTVESNLEGTVVVTVSDEEYAIGEAVQVSTQDGTNIGSGELYIHSQWNATAYSGTIADLEVSEEEEVDAGDTLMELEDTGYTAQYQQLSQQHREYEELMLELFRMYQSQQITAPADGMISGVDENSAYLLSDEEKGWTLNFLTNAPNADDETAYSNFVGQVTAVGIDGLVMKMNPQNLSITDYMNLSVVPTDPAAMTQDYIYSGQAPIYELVGGQWQQISSGAITAGDILLFAGDSSGNFVWLVRIGNSSVPQQPSEPTEPTQSTEPTTPSEPTDSTEPTEPSSPTDPTEPSDPGQTGTGQQQPGTGEQTGGGSMTGTGGQGGNGGMSGGASPSGGSFSSGGMTGGATAEEEPEFELYGLDMATIASVTAQDTMTLEITVDELDIGKLTVGQTANVKVNALNGETFTAAITEIGNSGTSDGGNSKFTVELTLERMGDMLPGMNATATITLDTATNAVTVPVAALNDEGSETFVYTSYDEETGLLGDPVSVTVGASNGENAEVLSGIGEGATYYYAYYDTLQISNAAKTGGFSFSRFGR